MAKILDIDLRTGSTIDKISGTVPAITAGNGGIIKTDKGLALNCDGLATILNYNSTIPSVGANSFSFEIYFNTKSLIGYQYTIFRGAAGLGPGFSLVIDQPNNGILLHAQGSGGSTGHLLVYLSDLRKYTWYHLIVIVDRPNAIVSGFLNGIAKESGVFVPVGSLDGAPVLTVSSAWGYHKGFISRVVFYNHILTENERAKAYSDFLNSYPMLPEKYPQQALVSKPMDLSREKNNTYTPLIPEASSLFTTDGTAWWSCAGGGTFTWNSNQYAVLTSAGTQSFIYRLELGIIGKTYRVRMKIRSDTFNNVLRVYIGTAIYLYQPTVTSSWVEHNFTLFADGTVFYIVPNIAFSGTIEFDNIQVEDISGLIEAYNMIPSGNSLVDISGNGNNGTLIGIPKTCKGGLKFDGKSSIISLSGSVVDYPVSYSFRVEFDITSGEYPIIDGGSSYAPFVILYVNKIRTCYYTGSVWQAKAQSSIDLAVGKIYSITCTISQTESKIYINGVDVTSAGIDLSINAGKQIMGCSARSLYTAGTMYDMRCYNRILSLEEHKAYHNSFVKPYLVEDFSSEGADGIAKVPTGWIKQSGSFKIEEWQPINDPLTDGDFNTGTGWILGAGWSITNGQLSRINTGLFDYTNQNISSVAGRRYRVVIDIASISSGVLSVFVGSSSPTEGNWTTPGTKTVEFINIGGTDFYIYGNQTFVGVINSVRVEEIPPLPTFKPGTKYLECITAGILALPSKQAYGTWEFDLYKGHTDNTTLITLMGDKPKAYASMKGYMLNLNVNECLLLQKANYGVVDALFQTTDSYIANNTWYRIKIIRTLSGLFSIYIKGSSFGTSGWTFVGNATVDNTITESDYFTLNIGLYDRIANIKLLDGIIQ